MKTQSSPVRIVVADDHALVRNGFCNILAGQSQIEIAGLAGDGDQLLRLMESANPDVVITDIKMPVMNGIEATKVITAKFPFAVVIALSGYHEDHLIIDMLQAGAKGYLLKDASREEFIEAILTVHNQQQYFGQSIRQKITTINRSIELLDAKGMAFSQREIEIIRLICTGFETPEISKKLFISKRTVDGHRVSIMRKTAANNIAGLVVFAIRYGLFEL